MSRMTTLREQPHSSLIYVRLASLNGTHRWRQRLVGAALATPATGMGCLCGPCFAARRVERGSSLLRPPLGCCFYNSRARRRMLWRAARRLLPFERRRRAPHFDTKSTDYGIAIRRAPYSRCGPRKVREQFNNSRCAPRYAGCRARCPKANKICFPESCIRAAAATTDATHR